MCSWDSHLDDLYGYQLSEQTISNITEAIMDKAKEWQNRPLEAIYPIVFLTESASTRWMQQYLKLG